MRCKKTCKEEAVPFSVNNMKGTRCKVCWNVLDWSFIGKTAELPVNVSEEWTCSINNINLDESNLMTLELTYQGKKSFMHKMKVSDQIADKIFNNLETVKKKQVALMIDTDPKGKILTSKFLKFV